MHRLFVAIRPPETVRDALIDAMDDSPVLGWVPDDNLHLTLRFIGAVERPQAEELALALAQIRSVRFNLMIHGVGKFEQRKGGAVWAGVAPKAPVAALAGKVDRACQSAGLPPEHRAFHPHITLARFGRNAKGEVEPFLRRNAGLASVNFAVDAFHLFESRLSRHGAHYQAVAAFPLA